MRGLFKLVKSVGRTLDLPPSSFLKIIQSVSDFLFICMISILPEARKGVPLPVEIPPYTCQQY